MARCDFDVVPVAGAYRVHKAGRRRDTAHQRFSDAEAAAARLVEANPEDTFIITREVARVQRHQEKTWPTK